MADTLRDIKLNEDRQVELGGDNDLRTTSGFETVLQSVGINAGEAIRSLIGQPITGTQLERVRNRIETEIINDPQIDNVSRVEIVSIDKRGGGTSVTIQVRTSFDETFTKEVLL